MVKRLSSKELKAGMITLEPVVTQHGQVIAPVGVELTRQLINRIKLYNINAILVNITEEAVEPISIPQEPVKSVEIPVPTVVPIVPIVPIAPVVPIPVEAPTNSTNDTSAHTQPVLLPETERLKNTRIAKTQPKSQAVVRSKEFINFQVDYLVAKNALKDAFINLARDKAYTIDEKVLVESISNLYSSRKTITELFDMIYQMRSLDDSIYSHSVNVALISRMIGRWLHLDSKDLDTLTCCGLLHDIGKLAIPDYILNKPGKLTEEEFHTIKSHPKVGYELLRNQRIDSRIKQATLMHHERYDGSGYPRALSEGMIADYAMIVAIADVYDAMTATRSYREPLCPFEVISNFEKEGFQKFPTKYLLVFLDRIATTYQNNRVLLNDGRACKIVLLNQNHLSKPMVQLDDGTCIDLSTQKDLFISKVL